MAVREMMRRLFRLRPRARPEAKARLMSLIPRGEDGAPATAGLADLMSVLERYRLEPEEVAWFERAIEIEAARAAGGTDDDQEN
mgnify:FL=1